MRWVGIASALVLCPAIAHAQEITLNGPLSGSLEPQHTEPGVAFTLHGMTGAMIAADHEMHPAPGSDDVDAIRHLAPRLDGERGYIGSGLRVFYQGRYARAGGTVGAFVIDRGLTRMHGAPARDLLMRIDASWGGHFEAFAGGQLELQPVFPYADLVGFLDVVQSRYELYSTTEGVLATPAYNAYLFGVGPRLGIIVPISPNIYLDLSATGGVVGANRFMFTAGFGYTTGERPEPGRRGCCTVL
jgi:hypothetical protein